MTGCGSNADQRGGAAGDLMTTADAVDRGQSECAAAANDGSETDAGGYVEQTGTADAETDGESAFAEMTSGEKPEQRHR